MIELRLRTRVSETELEQKVGKLLSDDDYNLLVTRAAKVLKPDGRPLLLYLPLAITPEMRRAVYPALHSIRGKTDNRGNASGTQRFKRFKDGGSSRTRTKPIASNVIGYMEDSPAFGYCRLTAYTAKDVEGWTTLRPLFEYIGSRFAELVPDRYKAQMAYVQRTEPEWVIDGTPFTTITVNNTYSTGMHTDKGDLAEGFSNLCVLRRGYFTGGTLVFPEYRVGVNMGDGDLLLMDAHEWHGNTPMHCSRCGHGPLSEYGHQCSEPATGYSDPPERISIVCYYRSRMVECGSMSDELAKATAAAERRSR